jgi:hypothetical protein
MGQKRAEYRLIGQGLYEGLCFEIFLESADCYHNS